MCFKILITVDRKTPSLPHIPILDSHNNRSWIQEACTGQITLYFPTIWNADFCFQLSDTIDILSKSKLDLFYYTSLYVICIMSVLPVYGNMGMVGIQGLLYDIQLYLPHICNPCVRIQWLEDIDTWLSLKVVLRRTTS